MRVPDFLIIGAPRSGTTALYTYLSSHPGIFMSQVKEPHYFSPDIGFEKPIHSFDQYLHLFALADPQQLCGEASASYLLSKVAIGRILRTNPAAKFIAMVRNPLDMLPSLHSQLLYALLETEPWFEAAWHRSSSVHDWRLRQRPCDYKTMGRLGLHVQRLFAHAPPRQRHIIVFDDFAADPRRIYQDTVVFLGLNPIDLAHFPIVNPRKRHRFPTVTKFLSQPPFPFDRMKKRLKTALPDQTRRIGSYVSRLNTSQTDRPPLSPELKSIMA